MLAQAGEELGLQQMDLAQVRLGGVLRHPGPVLNRLPEVRIANDATAFDEVNLRRRLL